MGRYYIDEKDGLRKWDPSPGDGHIMLGDRLDMIAVGTLVWCPLCGRDDNEISDKTMIYNPNKELYSLHKFHCKGCGRNIEFKIEGV